MNISKVTCTKFRVYFRLVSILSYQYAEVKQIILTVFLFSFIISQLFCILEIIAIKTAWRSAHAYEYSIIGYYSLQMRKKCQIIGYISAFQTNPILISNCSNTVQYFIWNLLFSFKMGGKKTLRDCRLFCEQIQSKYCNSE